MNNAAKSIFELMKREKCRQITFHYDSVSEMSAVFVIDSLPKEKSTTVSGGTRFAYSNADIALQDALKLARVMTRKANVLGVNDGGAKAVVLANKPKTKEFLESVGEFIQLQKGLFQTAIDLGFTLNDAQVIASKTNFIDSLSHNVGGLGSTGENTAEGMVHGFTILAEKILKKPLKECTIAIQGLGSVGMGLARRLADLGCKVVASDLDQTKCDEARKRGVEIVGPEAILNQEVDIFSPCAFGGVINSTNVEKLKCRIIAGGANNVLDNESLDVEIQRLGVVFVPDFILNCAGFLQALVEREGGTIKEAREKSKIVADKMNQVIEFSARNDCSLLESSLRLFNRIKN